MKVLLLNGSCRANGNTYLALNEIAKVLEKEGIDTEIFQIGAKPMRDCIGCGQCVGKSRCVFDDDAVNEFIKKAKVADGFIFGSPVYYAHADGRVLSFLDRAFYAGKNAFKQKPVSMVAVARRAGATATLDTLNKYATIAEMPLISSSYWNVVFGREMGEVLKDDEGLQTMRNLGKNMSWILKCIDLGRQAKICAPNTSSNARTNFIR